MDSIEQMRKLIDAVNSESFTAPLPQVAQNLAELATATKDMADRLALRIDKNINISKQTKSKPKSTKQKSKSKKPFPSLKLPSQTNKPKKQPAPQQQTAKTTQKPQSATATNPFATANPTYSSAITSNDFNATASSQASQPNPFAAIKPVPPQ